MTKVSEVFTVSVTSDTSPDYHTTHYTTQHPETQVYFQQPRQYNSRHSSSRKRSKVPLETLVVAQLVKVSHTVYKILIFIIVITGIRHLFLS